MNKPMQNIADSVKKKSEREIERVGKRRRHEPSAGKSGTKHVREYLKLGGTRVRLFVHFVFFHSASASTSSSSASLLPFFRSHHSLIRSPETAGL